MRHQNSSLGRRHGIHNWEFDDAADRIAGTISGGGAGVFTATHVTQRRVGLQLDDHSVWFITNHSPLTWVQANAGDIATLSAALDAEIAARETDTVNATAAINSTLFASRLPKSGAYTLLPADKGALVVSTANTWSLALTAAATLGNNFAFGVFNAGSGVLTVDPAGTETIRDDAGSAATKSFAQGEGGIVMCDGTGFSLLRFRNLSNVTNDAQLKAADLDTDGTFAANSDAKIASQKATKTYVDALIAASDAMVFKGVVDCSANPNYPAADRGHTYRVSVAGKIGGASGVNVEAGDILLCLTDSTASGNQATVGSAWSIIQTNLDGAVIGPASATDGYIPQYDGTTGKLLKSVLALDTDGTFASNSDAKVPTQKSVKTYADALVASGAPAETTTTIGALVNGATAKATPVDADMIGLMDSAAGNVWKKLSWLNLKATAKAYFDTLYAPIAITGDMVLASIQTITGAKTFNDAKLILAGLTSGTTVLKAAAVAGSTTVTLPGATTTLVGNDTADTLSNKTLASPVVTTQITAPKIVFTGSVTETTGTGSPEGVVTAAIGSTFRRTDGGTATTLYVKESGSGNTGWVAAGAGGGGTAASTTYSNATSGLSATDVQAAIDEIKAVAYGSAFDGTLTAIATYIAATTPKAWYKDAGVENTAGVAATNTQSVLNWLDQSGNGYHLTQATSGNKPTYQTGVLNSLPVVRFDGTNDYLLASGFPSIDLKNCTFIIVARTVGTGNDQRFLVIGASGSGNDYDDTTRLHATSGSSGVGDYFRVQGGTSQEFTMSLYGTRPTPWGKYTFRSVNQFGEASLGGVVHGNDVATTITNSSTGLLLGCAYITGAIAPTTVPLNGDFAEIIIWNRSLSNTELNMIMTKLAVKWGV